MLRCGKGINIKKYWIDLGNILYNFGIMRGAIGISRRGIIENNHNSTWKSEYEMAG